ncbi:MAG: hypothetical protein J2P21_26430 [Chloracidobacterium sp.]|nr:hypothetical protein [Chloracidobacterium sp.]
MKKLALLTVLTVLALIGVWLYFWQKEIGDDEVFILPKGYNGCVFILHDQKNGRPKRYELGKRVYEIPDNGILKTQFSLNTGWHDIKYFHKVDEKLIEIPITINNGEQFKSNETQVCCKSSGVARGNDDKKAIVFTRFCVGTKEEIRKGIERSEKLNIADLVN